MTDESPWVGAGGGAPPVSVIMTVRDAAGTVSEAVHSALSQNYPGPLEVVVAHGPSVDGTAEVLEALAAADPRVTVVPNLKGERPSGLNAAIATSSGEVLVRCDAQSRLPPDYVTRAVALIRAHAAEVVGGIQAGEGTTFAERAVAIAQSTPVGVGGARYRRGTKAGAVDTVYLGAYLRFAVQRVGGFDETLEGNEDYELNWRIRQTGGIVWFDPALRVAYRPRSSLGALWLQYFRYGKWKRAMVLRHPRSLRLRQLAAPLVVLGLAVLAVSCLAFFILMGRHQWYWAWGVLISCASFDFLLYMLVGDGIVCYRCGAEYRGREPGDAHRPHELVIAERDLEWAVIGNGVLDISENELEIWYSGKDELEVELITPSKKSLGRVPLGKSIGGSFEGKEVLLVAHRKDDPNNHENHIDIFF